MLRLMIVSMTQIFMSVLGGLHIRVNGSITTFRTEKNSLLLALIASTRSGASRNDIAMLLWPDAGEDRARQNIRQAIYTIRKTFEDLNISPDCLRVERDMLFLDETAWEVDLWQFTSLAERVRNHHPGGDELCESCKLLAEEALSKYTSGYLTGALGDSLKLQEYIERERIRHGTAATSLLQALWQSHKENLAYKQAQELLDQFPDLASGQQDDPEWMLDRAWCAFLAGQQEGAIRELETLEQADQPGAQELRKVLFAHPLSSNFNLEPNRTLLKGRDRDLESIFRNLSAGKRLISIIGREGHGKTSLVRSAGIRLLNQFRRFVYLVDLSKLQSPSALPTAICSALGLSPRGTQSPHEQLLEAVKKLNAVLILDGCEKLRDSVTPLVAQLLQGGAHLSIIVTSRVSLQFTSVENYAMLLNPVRNSEAEFEEIVLEPLEILPATRLLMELLQRQMPDFLAANDDIPLIADLVVRVQCVPLAIEMVAGQVAESGLKLAHQSLTRTLIKQAPSNASALTAEIVRWRLQQLNSRESRILHILSLFVSGAPWDAMKELLEREKISEQDLEVLSKRMLMECNPDTHRLRLHDLTREICLSQLAKNDRQSHLRDGYLSWAQAFVEQWAPLLEGAQGTTAANHLRLEKENLDQAILMALELSASEQAHVISGNLFRFWLISGNIHAGLEMYEKVLSRRYKGRSRLNALVGAGTLANGKGDLQQALYWFEAGLEAAIALQDPSEIVKMRHNLAVLYARTQQYDKAEEEFLAVIESAKASGDQRLQASCIVNLATSLIGSGSQDLERIRSLFEESLKLLEPLGDSLRMATVWNNLGILLHKMGDLIASKLAYRKSLALKQDLNDRLGTASTLTNIGLIDCKLGNLVDGLASLEKACQLLIDLNLPLVVPGLPGNLAYCLFRMGNHPEAALLLGASEQLYQELGSLSVHDEKERKGWMQEMKSAMGNAAFRKSFTKGKSYSGIEVLNLALELARQGKK